MSYCAPQREKKERAAMVASAIGSAREFCARNDIEMRILRGKPEVIIRITMRRPCPALNRAGQVELASQVCLDVRLSRHYPVKPPEVTVPGGAQHPFHPHFTAAIMDFRYAERLGRWKLTTPRWCDYQEHNQNETLAEFIYRVCQSLSLDPEYINVHLRRLANPDAARWYEDNHQYGELNLPLAEPLHRTEPPRSRPSFRIIGETRPQEPAVAVRPRGQMILATSSREPAPHPPALYIPALVMSQIFEHIGWGRRTAVNGNEQGGILVGRALRTPGTDELYTVVDHVISAESADGSAAYLRMDHSTWNGILERVDMLRAHETNTFPDTHIVGWYHTHPNELPVFMSGTDRGTQRTFFAHPSSVALVLNPHKKLWRAFFGADCVERRSIVYRPAVNGDS
jgi:hypothetical protein